ncbi:hypothetical protein [Pseudomonas sp. UBA1879]|uniref:hypothetical protein n=1 Tax=Pseudomonas sp. UBA1879 TaxID=1947305 RepID=UPI0025F0EDDF|nr:hypothetical protein [Pseudomonas sp. UBA1879]
MKATKRVIGACLALAAITTLPAVHAAYPKTMKVVVKVWNDGHQDLSMTHASWIQDAAIRDEYGLRAEDSGRRFDVTLNNPRNDSATFRYASQDGKVCVFRMAHETQFSWFGFKPNIAKSATGQSVGTASAQCNAMVTAGTGSLSSYTVRFSMK